MGLINEVVPLNEIQGYTYQLAQEISNRAPLSHKRTKQVLRLVIRNPPLTGLTPEDEHLPFTNFDSEDFDEGSRAFIERRIPQFKDR